MRRLSQQRHPGVCADPLFVAFALIRRVSVAETAHSNLLLEDTKESMKKFEPLEVVLGTILAVYVNHEVRNKLLLNFFL